MAKTDDRQWFKNPSVTDPEEIVARQVVTRVLIDHTEVDSGPGPVDLTAYQPFRVEDQETLVYTDQWGRRFMIEVTAHEITEETP